MDVKNISLEVNISPSDGSWATASELVKQIIRDAENVTDLNIKVYEVLTKPVKVNNGGNVYNFAPTQQTAPVIHL